MPLCLCGECPLILQNHDNSFGQNLQSEIMKTKSLTLVAAILFARLTLTLAATNDLSNALQKGLFEEEANHNLEAAIAAYQSVATQFDKDRKLAATAIFRLGEVYRKQGKTNEANGQYERILKEFPDQTLLADLSRNYLGKSQSANLVQGFDTNGVNVTSVEAEEIKRIKAMIKDSPDLIDANNAINSGGLAPLHEAAAKGQLLVARFLLDNGANANRISAGKGTPLCMASLNGHRAMVELLISKGADVNAKDSRQTALHIASANGFKAVAQVLLENKADVNAKDNGGNTPLHLAAERDHKAIAEFLLSRGANIDAKNDQGLTPLISAGKSRNLEMAKFLIANKADVNLRANEGAAGAWAPLHFAIADANTQMVELLLRNGANLEIKVTDNLPDSQLGPGSTALQMSVYRGQTEITKLLLESKANANSTNESGVTPLHWMANKGNTQIAELLLAYKADVNAKTTDGETPLLWAVKGLKKPMVELLLAHKSDPNLANNKNETPLGYANSHTTAAPDQTEKWQELRESLIKFGADENVERRKQIAVMRDGSQRFPIFHNGTNLWNRFSLLETFGLAYRGGGINVQLGSQPYLPFPNLTKVKIHRLEEKGERDIPVDLEAILKSGDCTKDIWLEWGDVIEFPEADHKVNEKWNGFPKELLEMLPKCLARNVSISVKGETKAITIAPKLRTLVSSSQNGQPIEWWGADGFFFWLDNVVSSSGLLRTSSDRTRVKVKRVNPETKQSQEMIFNLEKPDPQSNLWLREGDAIEISEK